MSTATITRPATERQQAFIAKLLAEKDTTGTGYDGWTPDWTKPTATSRAASEVIDFLLTLPSKATVAVDRERTELPDVPAGRYAVDTEEGHLAFYQVDRPTEGRWAGFTFVKVQASDELHPIKGFAAKASVLAKIAADPAAASLRYGREIGSCGVCGRTLTDEDSRARGIGPVCAEKTGW